MKKFNFLCLTLLFAIMLNAGPGTLLNPSTKDVKNPGDQFLVSELNTSNEAQSYPWLSDDALRVYYTHDKYMYMASRENADSKFNSGSPIFTNINEMIISGWLTPNELTIYFTNQSSKLFMANRKSKSDNFKTYTPINLVNSPEGSLFDATFTPDMEELLMYNHNDRERIVKFKKTGDNQYSFVEEVNVLSKEVPTGGQLSRDGLRYYVPFKRTVDGNDDYRYIYVLTRKEMHDNFNGLEQVKTTKEINITAYQPTVNSDETKMMFVSGAQNLWDNNELCEVSLVKEIVVKKLPSISIPTKPIVVVPMQVETRGDKNSGNQAAVYFSKKQNKIIYDYTGNDIVPLGYTKVSGDATSDSKPADPSETVRLDGAIKLDMNISPNPFNFKTEVTIDVPVSGYLTVNVYAMDGHLVTTLYEGQSEKGLKVINWFKNGISNGVYTVKAAVGGKTTTKKVVNCGTW